MAPVFRAPTPPRGVPNEDGRQNLWTLSREDEPPIRAELVSFADAVELNVYVGDGLRKRFRFLRDTGARRHADMLRTRLMPRGYAEVPVSDRSSMQAP